MMGERFARMWEFYLGAAELGFLHGSNMVFQILLSERRDDVPVVRDYMVDGERALHARGARARMPLHFAYGSNMSCALMRQHYPQARESKPLSFAITRTLPQTEPRTVL